MTETERLSAQDLTVGYGRDAVLQGLDLAIPDGKMTTIIGPNACGKSTLLRTLGRLMRPSDGQVLLDGKAIHRQSTRDVARRLGLLPQTPVAPGGMTVRELAGRGRTPHQSALRQWSARDDAAVATALEMTDLSALVDRGVEDLSGGQRQRAWIAMALAQETPLLLLDEPTTYLDLRHQVDLLSLVARLRDEVGKTVVMVLHDINLAARFSDHLVVLHGGQVFHQGPPAEVVSADLMRTVFDLDCAVISDPTHASPHVIPT